MNVARKLVLLAAASVAAMAFAASAANAQTVEVVNEITGAHCGAVTETLSGHTVAGGCHADVVGVDIDLAAHVFGIESQVHTDCRNEFDIRFNEDGGGKVADMLVSADGNSTPDCGVVKACNSEANPVQGHAGTHGNATRSVWNAQLNEIANGVLSSTVRTCFRTGNGLMPECEGDIVLAVSESTEDLLEAIANDTRIGTSGCEVTGHYDITEEVGEDVHINHL